MASLRVPDTGLQLDASGTAGTVPPNQAFAVTLSDNVIEDMIKCVQNGEDIQLSLGSTPVSTCRCAFLGHTLGSWDQLAIQ